MTTCLETFEKERFCSFLQRHGDVSPEAWDETRGRSKTSISCKMSSNFDTFDALSNRLECHNVPRLPRKTTWQPAWKPSKRRGFAASPIDTETPQENQRLETRHVGAAKRASRARLPPRKTTWQLAWKPSKRRGFAASPIDTEVTTRRRQDADPTTTRRRPGEPLEANKRPAPRPPDYKREPFATHSGKNLYPRMATWRFRRIEAILFPWTFEIREVEGSQFGVQRL